MNKNIKILGGSLIIVLIALIIYTSIIEIGNPDLKSHKDYVTKNIAIKDATAKNILKNLQLSQEDNFSRIDQKLDAQRQKTHAENIEIFIYQNSTLIYWSTNLIEPPPNNINSNLLWESGNGFYRIIQHKHTSFTFLAVYLIKKDYHYQNQYLQNTFNPDFHLPEDTDISIKKDDDISILDAEGNFIFSIKMPSYNNPKDHQIFIIAILYFLSIVLILKFLQNLIIYSINHGQYKMYSLLGYILILGLFRYSLHLLQYPKILYSSDIFSPHYYAYSNLVPSIGDLFIDVLFTLFLSVTVFKYTQKIHNKGINNQFIRFILSAFVLSIPIALFGIVTIVMESIVIDSRIQMDLYNIFNMTSLSVFGYIIIATVLASYILLSIPLIKFSSQLMQGKNIILTAITLTLTIFVASLIGLIQLSFSYLYIFLFILILTYHYSGKSNPLNWNIVLIITILFAIQSTHALHNYNTIREIEHRKLLAVNLSSEQRDPITEFLFQRISDKIFMDDTLKNIINDYNNTNFNLDSFESYLVNNYFTGYWNKFDVQITICSATDILNIQPDDIEINCINYFDELLATSTVPTESPELFFINYGPGENGYIAILDFSGSLTNISELTVFVEFFPKLSTQKLGFPDLLVDNSVSGIPEITGYSYAKYQDGDLYKRVGNYFYDIKFEPSESYSKPYSYYSLNNYNHLLYFIDNSRFLIISKEEKSILDILSPFSYLFTLYLFMSLIIIILFINPKILQTIQFSFKTRLQLSISFVLVFSFLFCFFYPQKANFPLFLNPVRFRRCGPQILPGNT